ncbi:MAG: hypothetical protein FWF52_00390 [Candidatus Azobacteroides sp.]|nr:hypothetical protein [Candidatus Azobacteroides sp.]
MKEIISIQKLDKPALIDQGDGYLDILLFIVFYKTDNEDILYEYIGMSNFESGLNYISLAESTDHGKRLIFEDKFNYEAVLSCLVESKEHVYGNCPEDIRDRSKEYLDKIIERVKFNPYK